MNNSASALDLIRTVVAHRPSGLMTDIDGTISKVADTPDSATVDAGAKTALRKLAASLDLVAAVSGRSADDARAMVSIDELVYSGNHGMEIWRNGRLEQSPLASAYVPKIEALLTSFNAQFDVPGLLVENKVLTASIHYRETDDPKATRRQILHIVQPLAEQNQLRITEGRMVIEVRPPIDLNKGTSVVELIEQFGLASGVFIGDDVTDVDAFRALRERRIDTGQHFYAIGVASDETPASIIENADALVTGVEGVVELLTEAGKIEA